MFSVPGTILASGNPLVRNKNSDFPDEADGLGTQTSIHFKTNLSDCRRKCYRRKREGPCERVSQTPDLIYRVPEVLPGM